MRALPSPRHIAALLALTAAACYGITWRVPEDVGTIQAALDTLAGGDTIVVSAGMYHESLQAPGLSFVMLGMVDSLGNPSRPVVDPTPLSGSTHLACLTLPLQSRAIISEFRFRNGSGMYPREHGDDVGGIRNLSAELTLTRCVLDSTYDGLYRPLSMGGRLNLFECEFDHNVNMCVFDAGSLSKQILGCNFSCSGGHLAELGDSSLIQDCSFLALTGGEVSISGARSSVVGCTFGPSLDTGYCALSITGPDSCRIQNNFFADWNVTGAVVMCYAIPGGTSNFTGNVFHRCHGITSLNAGGGLWIMNQEFPQIPDVNVVGCEFDSCTSWSADAYRSLQIVAISGMIADCQFSGHSPFVPQVSVIYSESSELHNSSFEHTGLALKSDSSFNAESNWWGDSTGPYHMWMNPAGLGDTVVGPVDFIPWLSDHPSVSPRPHAETPRDFLFETYPNPFNGTVHLRLIPNEIQSVKIELFDVLGRKVDEIWHGPLAFQKDLEFDASSLASGIYFARVTNSIFNRQLAMTKLVLLK